MEGNTISHHQTALGLSRTFSDNREIISTLVKAPLLGWPHVWVTVQSISYLPLKGCVDLALANRNK